MKKTVVLTILIFSATWLTAQESSVNTAWHQELVSNLNFTQNSFDNWAQGGEDSWSWLINLNGKLSRDSDSHSWVNTCKLAFGKTKVESENARKAVDEVFLESVFTRKLNEFLNPYVSFTAKTQFTSGYEYSDTGKEEISNFLDPGYFTQSFGLGYAPSDIFQTRFGGAVKETAADEYAEVYSDDPDTDDEIEDLKVEYGAESVTDLNLKLAENILFTSKLGMFSDLNRVDEVDVDWDNLFSAKVNEYINVSLSVKILYDKDIHVKRQMQQVLAVGVSYSFF